MTALLLAQIQTGGGTQTRAGLNAQTVAEYAEAMRGGAVFPPVVVFFDGADHWLADGFHRCAAAQTTGAESVNADIRQGPKRDALLHSIEANNTHGLRRTLADKQTAVMALLQDAEWSQWSDREIGRRCSVSHPMVARLRSLTGTFTSERKYVTKHGTTSVMNIEKNGGIVTPAEVEQMFECLAEAAAAYDAILPMVKDDAYDSTLLADATSVDVYQGVAWSALQQARPVVERLLSPGWADIPEYLKVLARLIDAMEHLQKSFVPFGLAADRRIGKILLSMRDRLTPHGQEMWDRHGPDWVLKRIDNELAPVEAAP